MQPIALPSLNQSPQVYPGIDVKATMPDNKKSISLSQEQLTVLNDIKDILSQGLEIQKLVQEASLEAERLKLETSREIAQNEGQGKITGLFSGLIEKADNVGILETLFGKRFANSPVGKLIGNVAGLGIIGLVGGAIMGVAIDGIIGYLEAEEGEKTVGTISSMLAGQGAGGWEQAFAQAGKGAGLGAMLAFSVGGGLTGALAGAFIGASIFGVAGYLGKEKTENIINGISTWWDGLTLGQMTELGTSAAVGAAIGSKFGIKGIIAGAMVGVGVELVKDYLAPSDNDKKALDGIDWSSVVNAAGWGVSLIWVGSKLTGAAATLPVLTAGAIIGGGLAVIGSWLSFATSNKTALTEGQEALLEKVNENAEMLNQDALKSLDEIRKTTTMSDEDYNTLKKYLLEEKDGIIKRTIKAYRDTQEYLDKEAEKILKEWGLNDFYKGADNWGKIANDKLEQLKIDMWESIIGTFKNGWNYLVNNSIGTWWEDASNKTQELIGLDAKPEYPSIFDTQDKKETSKEFSILQEESFSDIIKNKSTEIKDDVINTTSGWLNSALEYVFSDEMNQGTSSPIVMAPSDNRNQSTVNNYNTTKNVYYNDLALRNAVRFLPGN